MSSLQLKNRPLTVKCETTLNQPFAQSEPFTEMTTPLTPQFVFKSGPYRPVVMTAKDDNTVGQNISGSTGSPSGYYANPALSLSGNTNQQFSDFRIMYAQTGLSLTGGSITNYDAQFVKCGFGVSLLSGTDFLGNTLFMSVITNFLLNTNVTAVVENGTFNGSSAMVNGFPTNSSIFLINCILANVSNDSGNIYGGPNGFYDADMIGTGAVTNNYYPFAKVGEGQNYMTNGIAFINAGTNYVDSKLLTLLQEKTVNPPIVYSNTTISSSVTFSPQAQRDTAYSPSLGYHYDPIDYMFGGVSISSNITFTAGTAMGWFELPGNGGAGYAFSLANYMNCSFNGTVSNRCVEARYDTVQEGGDGLWQDKGWLAGIITTESDEGVSAAPHVQATFTDFELLTSDPNNVRDYYAPLIFQPEHSEFGSGAFGGYQITMNITNCLFDRSYVSQVQGESGNVVTLDNCTFHGGFIQMIPTTAIPITILNCSFDGTTNDFENYGDNTNYDLYDYNAYTNVSEVLPLSGSHDVILTNGFNWQTGPLGNYYLPTNSLIIDKGSTYANNLGLYYFTTQTNQVIEGNSIVDIGYHYWALNTNTSPGVLFDVDFGSHTNSSKVGYAAFGEATNDFWNGYAPNGQPGMLANLTTAAYGSSSVSMTVSNLLNVGTNGSPDPMYNYYLYTNSVAGTLTFSNLPSGNWNIYLYSDNGKFSLSVLNTNNYVVAGYGPETCYDQPLSSPLVWQEGVQYVEFTNVPVNSAQILSVSVGPATNNLSIISGLQLDMASP